MKNMANTQEQDNARDVDSSLHPIQKYVMGDMKFLNEWLEDKPILIQIPNWFLRGIGAPIFLNNPISGLLILIAMFVASPWMAINACLGLITAIITALLLQQPKGDIVGGGCTFHGMLVAIVISTSIDKPTWYPWTIFPVIVMSIVSVYLASGLGYIFGKFNLPAFNLPFNVAAFMFLGAVKYSRTQFYGLPNDHFPLKAGSPLQLNETFQEADLDWSKMFQPLLLGLAQVYGSDKLAARALILLAMLVASPIIFIHCLLGELVSVFSALAIAAPPKEIYTGQWSFNALLCSSCIGGFFFVLTLQSHILSLFAALFATVAHGAFNAILSPAGLPGMAFPFVFVASLFLAVGSESKNLIRVSMDQITYPEKHRKMFKPNAVADNPA